MSNFFDVIPGHHPNPTLPGGKGGSGKYAPKRKLAIFWHVKQQKKHVKGRFFDPEVF